MPTDEARLLVRLEASTQKLEKQLTKAASLAAREAGRMDKAFASANKRVERGFKNAASSASVFERELSKADRQVDALRVSVDPLFASTKRLADQEEILAAALRRGSISAEEHARSLSLLRAQADGASIANAKLGRSMKTTNRAFGGNQIQNVAFQIGDFATQVGSGQRASVALGQQLPQLLGGFGALGAVLGAVVAIGVPLGAAFLRMGGNTKELSERTDTLREAVQAYETAARNAIVPTEDLRKKYGEATGAAKTFLDALLEISQVTALQQVDEAISSLRANLSGVDVSSVLGFSDFEQITDEIDRLFDVITGPEVSIAESFELGKVSEGLSEAVIGLIDLQSSLNELSATAGVTEEQTLAVAAALDGLGAAKGPKAQADAVAALLALLGPVLGKFEDLPPAGQALVKELVNAGEAASAAAGQLERAGDAADDLANTNMSGGIDSATASAIQLADKLGIALGLARQIATLGGSGGAAGPDGAIQQVRATTTLPDLIDQGLASTKTFTGKNNLGGGRAGGRAGAAGGSSKVGTPFFEDAEKQLEALNRQIEAIGKTEREVAKLEAAYKLLDEAKKRGLDLDAKQAESGKTLREEIDAQAESIANLTEKARLYEDQAALLADVNDSLKDGLVDAIVEGGSFSDVLKDVAKQLAKAAIQAALFGGAFGSGTGGGGGLLGNLFGGLFSGGGGGGLLSFDGGGYTGGGARTGGVDGRGGFPAILHPNETVVDHTRARQGGGEITLRVMAEEGDMFRPTVRAEAAGVSVNVVQEAARKQAAMRRRG